MASAATAPQAAPRPTTTKCKSQAKAIRGDVAANVPANFINRLGTEYGWRVALQGLSDSGVLQEADFPDIASLKARWQEERSAWLAYVAGLDDAALNGVWRQEGQIRRTRWQTIVHVINDGTYHRSEAAAMLTGYGQSPGELDLEGYLVWMASQ